MLESRIEEQPLVTSIKNSPPSYVGTELKSSFHDSSKTAA